MNTSFEFSIYCIITFLVVLWCAAILAAPVLTHAGVHGSAEIIYSMFSRVCHQNDVHSFHIEGEKCGVCIRCSAIYFGFLGGLLILPWSGALKRMRIPQPTLILAFILPMVIDVVLTVSGIHISTTMTRLATGLFFGSMMPWCIVPLLFEACAQLNHKRKFNH